MDKYDNRVLTKINAAKSNRQEYRVVIQGEEPNDPKNYKRLTIVVTKDGKLVRTYYG
jgi:hypothetical protein